MHLSAIYIYIIVAVIAAISGFIAGWMVGRRRRVVLPAQQPIDLPRDLHQRLLPPPTFDADRLHVTARHVAADHIAGDFYDFVSLPGGRLLVVLADIAGEGSAAAAVMPTLQAMVPRLAIEQTYAAALLGQLNERLTGQLSRREFVALSLAIYEPSSSSLSIANAGLPDPLLISRDGAMRTIVINGPRYPIGIRRILNYESLTVKLADGDRILFFTDGPPEASVGAEPLGYERFTSEVLRARGDIDAIFASLNALGAAHDDDWTAVMLERRE